MQAVQKREEQIDELQQSNDSLVKDKNALELERDEVKQHASELVEKVKAEAESKEYLIDRRMINTFLVQYLNPKSDAATRQHMLDAMSKILGFTMEEKQMLDKPKPKKAFDPNNMTSSRQIHMLKSKVPQKPVVIKSE